MKKKKRRKPSPPATKGNTPKELAIQTLRFRERVLEICGIFGAREFMESLPIQVYAELFLVRFRPIKIIGMEGLVFPRGMIGMIRKHLKELYIKDSTFCFPGHDVEVSYSDYFTYILTLRHWYRTLDADRGLDKVRLGRELGPLLALGDWPENPERTLEDYIMILGSTLSTSPEKFCYYFEKDEEVVHQLVRTEIRIRLTFRAVGTDKKYVQFSGGDRREVFNVYGWNRNGLSPISLQSDDLNSQTMIKGLRLHIYMQNHALDRLRERLDVFPPSELFFHIGESVSKKEVVPDGSNRWLLRYYFFGHLLGYLVLEIIDGIIVIRTFLFLTNDSTPEGKKLNKILGVGKLDKKYTGLDQLSTFMHGNLKEDEQLYQALKDAGCSILLNIDPLLLERTQKKETMFSNEEIKNYLKIE